MSILSALPLSAQTPRWSRADCESYARTNALSILRSQLTRQNAAHNATGAWDAYLPRLSASATQHSQNSHSTQSGSTSLSGALPYGFDYSATASDTWRGSDDSAAWSLEISKRIWGAGSWDSSLSTFRNAHLADQSAELLLNRLTRELVETVRHRFHEIIRARQTHTSNTLRLNVARKNLEIAEANENPLDIANAKFELLQAEAQLLRSERLITDAFDRLKEILGLDPNFELDTTDALPETRPEPDLASDLAWVVEHSEDILIQQLRIQQLQNELSTLRESLGPSVSISASTSDVFGSSDSGPDHRVTLRASWPLGSLADRARHDIKQNDILDAKLQLRQTQISLHRQVLDLSRRLAETQRQIDVARQRFPIALMRVELYQDRWDNEPNFDILELIRAQNALEDARIELINQETIYFDLLASYIRLTDCDAR